MTIEIDNLNANGYNGSVITSSKSFPLKIVYSGKNRLIAENRPTAQYNATGQDGYTTIDVPFAALTFMQKNSSASLEILGGQGQTGYTGLTGAEGAEYSSTKSTEGRKGGDGGIGGQGGSGGDGGEGGFGRDASEKQVKAASGTCGYTGLTGNIGSDD